MAEFMIILIVGILLFTFGWAIGHSSGKRDGYDEGYADGLIDGKDIEYGP